jgi:CRP/FNR family transcriptional regulator, anaerobic regulatory protein
LKEKDLILAPLLQMLNQLKPLNKNLEEALINGFAIEQIKKGELLLNEGKVCTKLWFLSKGLLRAFHNIDDKEVTCRIMFNHHIVIAPGSFFMQTPSTESIDALSHSLVATITFQTLQKIYAAFPEFNYHTSLITEQYFYKQEQRLYMLRKHDGIEKYRYFLEHYENYLKEIPQKYIASFLNIAPETLSRIRKKLGQ